MSKLIKLSNIRALILELRGQRIMLDRDLAQVYGISTKRLNEAVKRNIERFPADFMFQLTEKESERVVAICDHLQSLKYSYQLPYAFTRNGANMLSAVLRTQTAVKRSIFIMRAFSTLEEIISKGKKKLASSPGILKKLSAHSRAIMQLFKSDKAQNYNIEKLHSIQSDVTKLLQQMILNSLGKRK